MLLKRVIGEHVLRMDQFRTLLLEASAVMNRTATYNDSHTLIHIQPLSYIDLRLRLRPCLKLSSSLETPITYGLCVSVDT